MTAHQRHLERPYDFDAVDDPDPCATCGGSGEVYPTGESEFTATCLDCGGTGCEEETEDDGADALWEKEKEEGDGE